ncbi:MAG: hypothetical protein GAK45_00180 [Pseudomonas citronellolis]|nr:MAG: hypothetical protein GAK45_00180 [Pseudomonas citronellolis]
MPSSRYLLLTLLAMLAFAGNSLLCRLALRETALDAASFTGIRLCAGALTLLLLLQLSPGARRPAGNWRSAAALFVYAAAFSLAYVQMGAASGALLLFGAVQVTMLGAGYLKGERLHGRQWPGLLAALGGIGALLLPGASAPPMGSALLMLLSGIAWALYSLLGRGGGDPLAATAGNFLRALPFAALLCAVLATRLNADLPGVIYAVLSGALASGVGYAIWYSALRGLSALQAASVQLSVPVFTALGGALFLAEPLSLRLGLATLAVLGGIALILGGRRAA